MLSPIVAGLMRLPEWSLCTAGLVGGIEEALALGITRVAGKGSAFGVSNHRTDQLAMLHRRFPLVAQQLEFSPLQLQALDGGTLTQRLDLGLQAMAWSPLAGGRLFGGHDERSRRVLQVLQMLANQHGTSPSAMAYAWLMRHPARPRPVTGSRRLGALREAVAATTLQLSA